MLDCVRRIGISDAMVEEELELAVRSQYRAQRRAPPAESEGASVQDFRCSGRVGRSLGENPNDVKRQASGGCFV